MSDEGEQLPEIDESVVAEGTEEAAFSAEVDSSAQEAAGPPDLGLIMDVPLRLSVEVGSTRMPVRDVLALSKGSVVELDRSSGEPADIYVNDRLIARGEIAHEDDRVAIRVTELIAVTAAAGLA